MTHIRNTLKLHQEATDTSDSDMLKIVCDWIEECGPDVVETDTLIDYVQEQLERGPGDIPAPTDENGADAYHEDWLWLCKHQGFLVSTGQRITTALALRIAADILRGELGVVAEDLVPWTDQDLKLALGVISGVRAQSGVMGPDAEALNEPNGLYATRQIDIWVFG